MKIIFFATCAAAQWKFNNQSVNAEEKYAESKSRLILERLCQGFIEYAACCLIVAALLGGFLFFLLCVQGNDSLFTSFTC